MKHLLGIFFYGEGYYSKLIKYWVRTFGTCYITIIYGMMSHGGAWWCLDLQTMLCVTGISTSVVLFFLFEREPSSAIGFWHFKIYVTVLLSTKFEPAVIKMWTTLWFWFYHIFFKFKNLRIQFIYTLQFPQC